MLWPTLLCCVSCSQAGSIVGSPPAELPLPEGINVVFNHRDGGRYRSPLTDQWRNGDDLEQFLVDAIHEAQQEILIAVQELSSPTIAEALVAAQQRGITIKLVLENNYSQPWSEQHPADLSPHQRKRQQQLKALADRNGDGLLSPKERQQSDAIAILKRHNIPFIDDTEDGSAGSGLMHHKFLVIDEHTVVTGSANFTSSGFHGDAGRKQTRGNVNHLLRFRDAGLAKLFKAEFQRLWGDGPGGAQDSQFGLGKEAPGIQIAQIGATRVEVLFAPHPKRHKQHGLQQIGGWLSTAQQGIDMALFVFSAQSLANQLQESVNKGVKVRLLADPSFASRSFSEVLDLLGVELPDRFCKLERNNKPYSSPLQGVGTPRLARGDKLHHKFAVIDNKKVITGSFNWSPSAAHTNDETLLMIDSPKLAAHFTREMNRMWRGAELGISPRIKRKLERQRAKCGSGVERNIEGQKQGGISLKSSSGLRRT